MAHKIETIAYAGETPWHGLGASVSNNLSPEEMRIAAGLTWGLTKTPIYTQTADGSMIMIKGRYSLMRDSDNRFYDIVSDLYKPVQPEDALAFFKRFIEAADMTMETAGSLENGKRIWALAKIGKSFTLKGGDRVEGYLLLCSPNVSGKCLEIKFTTVRVVCHNTLTAALGSKAGFQMAHWHKFDEAMHKKAETALNIASSQLDRFADQSRMLSETKATQSQVLEYVARLVQPELLEAVVNTTAQIVKAKESGSVLDQIIAADSAPIAKQISPDDFNRAGRLILESIIDSPGSALPSARGTWFGALNGVTHAVDHKMGRNDTRLAQSWFGHKERMKNKAVEIAVDYATAANN